MAEQRPELPAHVTMPLLTLITRQSLDEEYRLVARRRAAAAADGPGRQPAPGRTAALPVLLAVTVVGLLLATAAVQTTANAISAQTSRSTLVARIDEQRAALTARLQQIVTLREQNAAAERDLETVSDAEQAANARLRRLQVRTGFVAVRGPGVRILVDDPPGAGDTERVRDEDLALLVDGLWNAGAEAVSVDGERLTALTAIRNSGPAVRVNSRSLTPPYTVLAIGDPRTLQAQFAESTHGQAWLSLARELGFRFDMHNEDTVSIPSARLRPLRSARAGSSRDQSTDQEVTP